MSPQPSHDFPDWTVEQRLADIRRRVHHWRNLNIGQVMAQPGFAYGCMADIALLQDEIDVLNRQIAHPRRSIEVVEPAIAGPTTSATPMHAMPAARLSDPDVWNAALVAGAHRVDEAIGRIIANRGNIYDARRLVANSLRALERSPGPIAPLTPTDEPPFTA